MARHGISECVPLKVSDSPRTASPMISTCRSTADRKNRSASYSAKVRRVTNDCTARAAVSISSSHATSSAGLSRSRGIHHPITIHDGVATKWISNAAFFNDIDRPTENRPQVVLNLGSILERESVAGLELQHDVDVTFGSKVLAQYRPKQRELLHAILPAECFDLFHGQFGKISNCAHKTILRLAPSCGNHCLECRPHSASHSANIFRYASRACSYAATASFCSASA